ncbi:hypothetical protein BDZ97DRAFT_1773212, partial [Flammula alnicola]
RILPRLIAKIKAEANQEKFFSPPLLKRRKLKSKSFYKPVPPAPSFHPADYPRSILLAPRNPIVDSEHYARHKKLPPTLCRPTLLNPDQIDPPRQMTDREFGWWANPYRM